VLAAVGHEQRARILRKLLDGPATYRALQRLTKLKAGPLYHHVNQLRLNGLILPKQRDLYELTRGGRNVILAVLALGSLIRDGRRRPLAGA
jgi:predicted transcriptional regulator